MPNGYTEHISRWGWSDELRSWTWPGFENTWHVRPELNRGMWADDAAHAIDFLLWLFDGSVGEPESVIAEIRNVVVYIKDAMYRGALPATRAELRQEHETFIPHTVAITRGSSVDFPNGDPFFHNVFSLSRAANFNLGRYERGQSRAREFTKAGTIKVYCDIHSHMSATILVFDHPYFTIPGPDGSFELPAIPAGQYTIVGWHERVGERLERVRVEAGKAASIELTVPVPVDGGAP